MAVHRFPFGIPHTVDQGVAKDRHDTVKTLKGVVKPSLEFFRRWRNSKWHPGPAIPAPGGPKGGQHTAFVVHFYIPDNMVI